MSDSENLTNAQVEEILKETRDFAKKRIPYVNRFKDRKPFLQDVGLLNEYTAAEHIMNEMLMDIFKRLEAVEQVIQPAPEFIEEER